MANSFVSQVGSDRLNEGGLQHQDGPRIDMSDQNIRSIFQPTTDQNAVVQDGYLSFGSPFADSGSNRVDFGANGGNFFGAGEASETAHGNGGFHTHFRDAMAAGDASTANSPDQFLQQLNSTDPKLAAMLSDAQSTISATGAAQLEANVSNNFNNNNGQFSSDSSLMNASIGQLASENVSNADITAAQNSLTADVANPNIGDAPVSNFSNSVSAASTGDSSGSSPSDSPVQQDINQLMQDLQSGNFQQFLSDLMQDLSSFLGQPNSSPSDTGGSSGGSSPSGSGGSPEVPGGSNSPPPTDGTNPVSTPAPAGSLNPLGQQLADTIVKNDGTAQASTVAQVKQTLEYGTPQAVLQALQQNGTQITVTGSEIGSAGTNNGSNQITITDNPNDMPANEVAEATEHEASEVWSTSNGFTSSSAFQSAAQKDLANLPAGSLTSLPIDLVDAPVMTAADGTQVGMTDVVSELSTYIAATQSGDTAVAASGEGAKLAQLFPDVYALEQQALG